MKRAIASSLAVVVAFLTLPFAASHANDSPPPPENQLVLDHGHVDAFHISAQDDGQLLLELKEDVTAQGTLHRPEDVLLHLKPDALTAIPDGYPGSPQAYFLPLTQDHNLLWPGWETTPVRNGGFNAVDINITAIEGPGEVFVWSQSWTGLVSVLADGGYQLPGTIHAPFPAHTHANWAFTEPGAYTFTVQASAEKDGQVHTSQVAYYNWYVGAFPDAADNAELTEETRGSVVAPEQALEGSSIRVQVGADRAGEKVRLWLHSDPVLLGELVVDAEGYVEAVLGNEISAGEHRVVVQTMHNALIGWDDITITAPPAAIDDADLTEETRGGVVVIPEEVLPGESIQVDLGAERAGSQVRLWLHGDAALLGEFQADANGVVEVVIGADVAPGDHRVVAQALTNVLIGWDDLTVRSEPVETTITIEGLAHHYHSGDTLALEATQEPDTGEDHWHWYIQRAGEDDYTVIEGQGTSTLSYVVAAEDDGASIIARLFGHDHVVIGESEPVVVAVDDHDGDPSPDPDPDPSPDPDPDDDRIHLDHGHVDAFYVVPDGNGVALKLKEDVTGVNVVREPEDAVLVVKEAALTDLSDGVPGAPDGYLLPLTQDPDLLWPGWDTQPAGHAGFGHVDISVTEIEGPGEVYLFGANDITGDFASFLADGGHQLPGTIEQVYPAHAHANWVFTEAGEYTFTVQAEAFPATGGQSSATATHTYVWKVGDYDGDPGDGDTPPPGDGDTPPPGDGDTPPPGDGTTPPPGDGDAPPPGDGDAPPPGGGTTPPPDQQLCIPTAVPAESGDNQSSPPASNPPGNSGGGSPAGVVTGGHLDLGAQIHDGALVPSLKDDRQSPPEWVGPGSVVFSLQKKSAAPDGMEFIADAGSDIWLIPATQDPDVPWLGWNTQHESFIAETEGTLTLSLNGTEGPGDVAIFASGTFGGGIGERQLDSVGGPTAYTVPANTHAHPNFVFNAPGHYKVNLTMSATLKNGQQVSGDTTLHFAVAVDANQVAASVGSGEASGQAGGDVPAGGNDTPANGGGTKIVGRTPSGEPCNLPGVPNTGSDGLQPQTVSNALQTTATPRGGPLDGTALGVSIALLVVALAALRIRRGAWR